MLKVVTDSTSDLAPDVLEELGVAVAPLVVRIGDEEFLETDLSRDEFWSKVGATCWLCWKKCGSGRRSSW